MDRPIKVGMLGLGRAGMGMHLNEYRPRLDKFQIYGVCDLIPERSEKVAAEFGSKIYRDFDELLADEEVELVDIATRSCDHYAHAKKALLAGKDVMLEKPFAMTYAEARELADLGSQPDLTFTYATTAALSTALSRRVRLSTLASSGTCMR